MPRKVIRNPPLEEEDFDLQASSATPSAWTESSLKLLHKADRAIALLALMGRYDPNDPFTDDALEGATQLMDWDLERIERKIARYGQGK